MMFNFLIEALKSKAALNYNPHFNWSPDRSLIGDIVIAKC